MTKAGLAHKAVMDWEWDMGGVKGYPEPTANEIIRGIAARGWYGHGHTPYSAVKYFSSLDTCISASRTQVTRPAKVRVIEPDGNHLGGVSMISEGGYVPMASLERAKRLYARYARFVEYMTETRHHWTFVQNLHFADNSIEREERSQLTGATRRRMTLGPGGDVCF